LEIQKSVTALFLVSSNIFKREGVGVEITKDDTYKLRSWKSRYEHHGQWKLNWAEAWLELSLVLRGFAVVGKMKKKKRKEKKEKKKIKLESSKSSS
jgi:hypothetical protein